MSLIIFLLNLLCWAVIILVFVRAALSWISPYPTNDFSRLVYRVTDPILMPIRRRLPPVSGLDLSPLVVLMALFFVMAALRSIS